MLREACLLGNYVSLLEAVGIPNVDEGNVVRALNIVSYELE